jgi:GxxExxY protein
MDTNKHECREDVFLKDEVYEIVSCAIEVINDIGHGIHEKPYENALVIEFGLRCIPVVQQREYPVLFKGQEVGLFIPDLIVYDQVIVDAKVVDKITDHERGQMLNYLKITGMKVGVLLNFKKRKLEWERLVL